MKKLLSAILIAISLINYSCDSTEPPNTVDPPGRRDYTWTVDTLKDEFLQLRRMWGSSPNDVWVAGGGSTSDGVPIYHYDGNEWKKAKGSFLDIDALYGFSSNDVWAGGQEGWLYHYNGTEWTRNYQYIFGNNAIPTVLDLWGTSPNNLFAVGVAFVNNSEFTQGFVLHYDGKTWQEVSKGDKNSYYSRLRSDGLSNKYYIYGFEFNGGNFDTLKIYSYQNQNIKEIFKGAGSNKNIFIINDELFVMLDIKVYKLKNDQLTEKIQIDIPNLAGVVNGRSFSDMFVAMGDGYTHFNGSDYEYIIRFPYGGVYPNSDALIFNDIVFLSAKNLIESSNYIYIGKLDGG